MSGEFQFAAAYLALLGQAGFSRYEELREVQPEELTTVVRVLNDGQAVFDGLPPRMLARGLVRRALTGGVGQIVPAHLPDDAHPCWGGIRLGLGGMAGEPCGGAVIRGGSFVSARGEPAPGRGAARWEMPDEATTYARDAGLPGKSDLGHGWPGKPGPDDGDDTDGGEPEGAPAGGPEATA